MKRLLTNLAQNLSKNRASWRKISFLLLALACALVLPACGEDPAPVDPDVTVLTYAILDPENTNLETINAFNRTHKDVKIQPKNYTRLSENGKQGADLLNVELATGKVPDIIDLGSDGQLCQLSYRALAQKGYSEDLWPYIENDPDLGRKGVIEAFLKPAEVDGKLYTVYKYVRLCTLVGAESVVGDRTGWTLEEMMEAFDAIPEAELLMDDAILLSKTTIPSMKHYLLTSILSGFTDLFVDPESGQCFFDSQQFRDILELINSIPDTPDNYVWRRGYDDFDPLSISGRGELYDTLVYRQQKRKVMLRLEDMSYGIVNMRFAKLHFGDRPVPVGFPMGKGVVGSYYQPWGSKLCMASTCADKAAAWEFIRQMFFYKTVDEVDRIKGLPVSKRLYSLQRKNWYNLLWFDEINYQMVYLDPGKKEEIWWLEEFFESITRCSLFLEPAVLEMIEEEAAAYFAGAATLDQAVDRIQRRATLYVNESR